MKSVNDTNSKMQMAVEKLSASLEDSPEKTVVTENKSSSKSDERMGVEYLTQISQTTESSAKQIFEYEEKLNKVETDLSNDFLDEATKKRKLAHHKTLKKILFVHNTVLDGIVDDVKSKSKKKDSDSSDSSSIE